MTDAGSRILAFPHPHIPSRAALQHLVERGPERQFGIADDARAGAGLPYAFGCRDGLELARYLFDRLDNFR